MERRFFAVLRLFLLKTVATSATFRVAITGIADMDFAERAIVASAIKLAFRDIAADAFIDICTILHRHSPPFFVPVL